VSVSYWGRVSGEEAIAGGVVRKLETWDIDPTGEGVENSL